MEINSNQNKKENDSLEVPRKGMHTLNQDIEYAAEAGTPGTIKAIIDAEEGREKEKEKFSLSYSVNQLYMIFGFLALLLSAFLVYYFVFFMTKDNIQNSSVSQSFKNIFLVDKTVNLEIGNLTKTKILKNLYDEIEKTLLKENQIQSFYLAGNDQKLSLSSFLEKIEANISLPEGDIFNQEFMYGVFVGEGNHPFLLFKIKSMNEAFTTMRNWENKMLYDLGQIFGYEISSSTQYLLTKDFIDEIIQNKNARVLRDEFGSMVLFYVYLDDNTILITDDDTVVGEIIKRQNASNIKK